VIGGRDRGRDRGSKQVREGNAGKEYLEVHARLYLDKYI